MEWPPGLFHLKNPEFVVKTKLPTFRKPTSAPVFLRLHRQSIRPAAPRQDLQGGPGAWTLFGRCLSRPWLPLTAQAAPVLPALARAGLRGSSPRGERVCSQTCAHRTSGLAPRGASFPKLSQTAFPRPSSTAPSHFPASRCSVLSPLNCHRALRCL